MELTAKQKQYLRGLAHPQKPLVQIGTKGIQDSVVEQISEQLSAHELVKVRFNELMRTSAAGVSVFLDTDRDVKGPEYVLSSGLGDGTDYVLTEADGWRGSDDRVSCDYAARPKWGQEVFRAVLSRECFDRVPSVRVSVKMVDQADGSHPVRDWAPKRHRWSLPVATGLGA